MTKSKRLITAVGVAGAVAAVAGAWALSRRRRPQAVSWRGRVAIVTGGSRGLGLAIARELAHDGVTVWLVARHVDELESAVNELRASGADAHSYPADITDADAVGRMVQTVIDSHGRLDVLVNNAGVITAMPFDNAQLSDFEESINTHFWGPLHLIRASLPWLRRARPGHIINVSSIGGRVGVPHLSPYCAGKFALTGLSEVLRAELARDDIWVTTVTPGLMRTGSVGKVKVRGRHVAEGTWFAAMSATSLTSMSADSAARGIVAAARRGRAVATPGWQAHLQHLGTVLAPELAASLMETVTSAILPAPAETAGAARTIDSLDLGAAQALISPDVETAYNQR